MDFNMIHILGSRADGLQNNAVRTAHRARSVRD
jgi:hypothetical protein